MKTAATLLLALLGAVHGVNQESPCPPNHFQCGQYTKCLDASKLCDNVRNCKQFDDFEDEGTVCRSAPQGCDQCGIGGHCYDLGEPYGNLCRCYEQFYYDEDLGTCVSRKARSVWERRGPLAEQARAKEVIVESLVLGHELQRNILLREIVAAVRKVAEKNL